MIDDLYNYPLYRPPSEAYSLIIQITLGCSHNKCTFCNMYKGKQFTIKPFEKVKSEIDFFRSQIKHIDKIFLADGDALIMRTESLIKILKYINLKFPEVKRISLYASPRSILLKTEKELEEIRNLGVSLVYMGLESGDNETLKEINKGATAEEITEAALKMKKIGFQLSVTVIAGILGNKDSTNHAVNTGKVISKIIPDYLGILCLVVHPETDIDIQCKKGEFVEASGDQIMEEIKLMIENINIPDNEKIIFRSNHASNYLNLKGNFPEDKDRLLDDINYAISNDYIRQRNEQYLKYSKKGF
ncbi:radical SAM protein [Fusobacterium sp. IOR10]|uniref:radical SAM protein n=1 Tax=Fusobacterium sp. IOR10 TaxID=2665157 RepID=UPI0013D2C0D6|nr:radical SAM protein [Fusobacterium sp. IOR10]